jgi:syntaxin-binding protein 1
MVEDLINPANDVFTYTFVDSGNKSQEREVILNESDVIWRAVRHLHIQHAKAWIANEFKKFREQTKDMQGGHDITKTLRAMPKFQTLKAKFSVHLNLAKDCMDVFNRTAVERLCALEQDLATGLDEFHNKTSNVPTRLVPLLNDGIISKENKIRILMLYYLTEDKATEGRSRFEGNARLTADEERILTNFIAFKDLTTRTDQRRKPLADNEWEFVVSRYMPAMKDILTDLAQGRLASSNFPFLNKDEESQTSGKSTANVNLSKRQQPVSAWGAKPSSSPAATPASAPTPSTGATKFEGSRLIVFVSGGITYSEMREVHKLSKSLRRDIILGSTHILKPNEFLAQVGALTLNANDKAYNQHVITKK